MDGQTASTAPSVSNVPRKRVLILVENLPVPFDRRVWMQATTLHGAGYQVTVICPRGHYPSGREVLQGITIYRYPLPSLSGITGHLAEYAVALVMTAFLTCVVQLREGFDVIQSANPPDLFFLIGALFKLRGVPFVFDQHDGMPEICAARWQGWKQALTKWLCLWAEWATFRTADRVIANNESYRAIARGRGGVPDHCITVVRNAPGVDRFRAVTARAERKGGADFLVAYLGVIGPNDGLDLLLEAIAHIVRARAREDLRFVVIGSGDLYAQTVALCSSMDLDAYVRFTGRIPDDEVIEWLSSADVCVAPDPKDPLNDISSFNKIVEYMAIGKPIVAFDLPEVRISAGSAAMYAAANDTAAFGDAIVALVDAPAQRHAMGAAGRHRFETVLAWEHQAPRLLALYRDLLWGSRIAMSDVSDPVFPLGSERSDSTLLTGNHRDYLGTALWVAALIWVIGMATVFPVGNDALEAVSVLTFDRIGFLAVALLIPVAVARQPGMLRSWGRVEALMALFTGVAVLSWAATLSGKTVLDLKRDVNLLLTAFVMPYTAFLVARHAQWTRWRVVFSYRVIVVLVGFCLIVMGLIQGVVDSRFLVVPAHQGVHMSRARGAFDNAVPYSVLLALLVPIALGLRAHAPRRPLRVLLVVLCIGLVEALVLGQTRVVWVALPLALLYLAVTRLTVRTSALVMAGGLLTAIALSTAGIDLRLIAYPDGAVARAGGGSAERIGDAESIYNRVAVYSTALNMIVHRPVLGFGFGARTFLDFRGDYYASCCGVSSEWAIPCAVPHNEALNVLILLGSVGLIVYLALLRELWRLLAAHAADSDPMHAILAACVQAAFIVLALTGLMHDVMYWSAVQVVFFFLAGLATPAARCDAR